MRISTIVAAIFCLALTAAKLRAALPITAMAGSSPTTAPADPVSVMLLSFRPIGAGDQNAWISSAINEDLTHDLSRNSAIRVIKPSTTQPSDGLAAARDAKADRLISGSYQVVDDQLRVTAEVIDPNQAQPIGQIKATGRVRDLFQIEDSLATQLWRTLPRPSQETPSAYDFQVTPLEDDVNTQPIANVQEQPLQDQVSTPAPIYNSTPDFGPYDYGSPYANYGYYPYSGIPLFLYGGYGHGYYNHGGHNGGHDGGGHYVGAHGSGSVSHFSAAPHIASGGFAGGHR